MLNKKGFSWTLVYLRFLAKQKRLGLQERNLDGEASPKRPADSKKARVFVY